MKLLLPAFPLILLAVATAQDNNPKPLPDDLQLPLPGSQTIVFRPVSVGPAKNAFVARIFKIGDRAEGGFQEFPTDVSVGGAVAMELGGQPQWVYFLGKYEVTEAQWHAVMGTGTERDKKSQYPRRDISWFEAQEFIHKLNEWLFQNALDQLPKNQNSPCFVRLPTEAEWEFAARGGIAVTPNEFDRKHPYTDDLGKYEWFAGPRSSNDKASRIGIKQPNPLGLHDMLGNVAEMTCSQYSVEYYQGRVGGLVTRGGHFFTSMDQIRASARDELTLYNPDNGYQPRHMETLGLRLALASPIFVNPHVHKQMEAEWDSYRNERSVPTLASPSAPNRAAQADGRINELGRHLDNLQQALRGASLPPDAMSALGLAVGAAQNIQADANNAGRILASTLIEAAILHGNLCGHTSFEAALKQEIANDPDFADERADYLQQVALLTADAKLSEERYSEDIRRLAGTREELTREIIETKLTEDQLRSQSEKSRAGIERRLLLTIQEHLEVFRRNQRADPARYHQDFLKIYMDNP